MIRCALKEETLLDLSAIDEIKATVIFRPAHHKKWLNKILQPGFCHVCVVIHKPNSDVLIDPRIGYTEITVFPPKTDFHCLGETQVQVKRRAPIAILRGAFGPVNCVEQAKMFLGIKDWKVFTPYKLYNYLRK